MSSADLPVDAQLRDRRLRLRRELVALLRALADAIEPEDTLRKQFRQWTR